MEGIAIWRNGNKWVADAVDILNTEHSADTVEDAIFGAEALARVRTHPSAYLELPPESDNKVDWRRLEAALGIITDKFLKQRADEAEQLHLALLDARNKIIG